MKLPWQKDPPASETAEEKLKREEAEQTAFFGKIGELVKNEMKPVADTVADLQGKWKKLEESAAADEHDNDNNDDANLTEEEKRRKNDEIEKRKILALSIMTNARITENEVLQEVHTKFPEYESKIREYFANTPIERKGQADYAAYCQNIVDMVLGKAARAGGLRYDTSNKRFFLEDASGGDGKENYDFLASDVTWQDPRSGKIVTGREQLAKLGITPEEFRKSQEKGIV